MKRHTPYFHKMAALGAQFQDRLGFATVNAFSTVEQEALVVRNSVGVFDVAYQVAVAVQGRDSEAVLATALTNDVRRLKDGEALYSPICKADGGVLDDLTCFRFNQRKFWLSPSPGRVGAVIAAVQAAAGDREVVITNMGYAYGYISVQGPRSRDLLAKLTDIDLSTAALPYFSFTRGTVAGIAEVVVSRTGYSGELGYELFYPSEYGEYVWEQVFDAGAEYGVVPCGMKTMRSLRIEKMYVLNGLDLTEKNDPISAGLGWTVRLNDRDFVGKAAIQTIKAQGPSTRLCLLQTPSLTGAIATGDLVMIEGEPAATVTSADPGYTLGAMFAYAYLPTAHASEGMEVAIAPKTGGETICARVLTRAPYDPDRSRLRV